MMNKLPQSHQGKEKSGFWLLNPASKVEQILITFFFLLLPTQFGKHFWPDFSVVSGIRIDYLSPTFFLTDFLLVCLLLFWLKRRGFTALVLGLKKRKMWIIVCCYLLLGALLSDRLLLGVYGWIKFLEFSALAFYLTWFSKRFVQYQLIAFLFACSALFESVLSILQYLQQGSLNGWLYFFGERTFTGSTPGIANASLAGVLVLRPYGTFSHPNVLAGYLLVTMVLIWSFLLQKTSRRVQIFSIISLSLSSIALLLTLSRVTILLWGVILSCLLLGMLVRKLKSFQKRLTTIFIVLVGLFFIGMLPLSQEVITRFSQTSLAEESFAQRSQLTGSTFALLKSHPLIGVGLDNFLPFIAPLQKPLALGLYLQPVHNIFLLVSAETGVIGLGLFLWFLFATFQRIKKQSVIIRKPLALLLSVVLVIGLFDHYWLTVQQGQLLFTTILGLSWTQQEKEN